MDLPDDARQDPIWERSGHTGVRPGRLPGAVAVEHDAPDFGFCAGDVPGWLPQPAWFAVLRRPAAGRPGSTLTLYRDLWHCGARSSGRHTDVDWLATGRDDVVAYRRGALTVVVVFGDDPYEPPAPGAPDGCPATPTATADGRRERRGLARSLASA